VAFESLISWLSQHDNLLDLKKISTAALNARFPSLLEDFKRKVEEDMQRMVVLEQEVEMAQAETREREREVRRMEEMNSKLHSCLEEASDVRIEELQQYSDNKTSLKLELREMLETKAKAERDLHRIKTKLHSLHELTTDGSGGLEVNQFDMDLMLGAIEERARGMMEAYVEEMAKVRHLEALNHDMLREKTALTRDHESALQREEESQAELSAMVDVVAELEDRLRLKIQSNRDDLEDKIKDMDIEIRVQREEGASLQRQLKEEEANLTRTEALLKDKEVAFQTVKTELETIRLSFLSLQNEKERIESEVDRMKTEIESGARARGRLKDEVESATRTRMDTQEELQSAEAREEFAKDELSKLKRGQSEKIRQMDTEVKLRLEAECALVSVREAYESVCTEFEAKDEGHKAELAAFTQQLEDLMMAKSASEEKLQEMEETKQVLQDEIFKSRGTLDSHAAPLQSQQASSVNLRLENDLMEAKRMMTLQQLTIDRLEPQLQDLRFNKVRQLEEIQKLERGREDSAELLLREKTVKDEALTQQIEEMRSIRVEHHLKLEVEKGQQAELRRALSEAESAREGTLLEVDKLKEKIALFDELEKSQKQTKYDESVTEKSLNVKSDVKMSTETEVEGRRLNIVEEAERCLPPCEECRTPRSEIHNAVSNPPSKKASINDRLDEQEGRLSGPYAGIITKARGQMRSLRTPRAARSGSVGRNATEVEEANEQQVFQSRHILHRTKQVPVGLRSGGHGSTIFELKVSPPRVEDKVLIENDIVIDKSTSGLTLEPDKTPMIPAMSMLFSPDGSHTSIHSFMGESIQGDQSTSWKQGSQAQRSFILGYESVASTIA